tara:strand:+ start:376 stop:543 length:168 start_codon:yes stop_codon:yes gene_type:complete
MKIYIVNFYTGLLLRRHLDHTKYYRNIGRAAQEKRIWRSSDKNHNTATITDGTLL